MSEFGKLVEKENTPVAEAYLTRPWPATTPDKTGMCPERGTLACYFLGGFDQAVCLVID